MVAKKKTGELSFYDIGSRDYDPTIDTLEDVHYAVRELLETVASDLGVDDASDPAFVSFARDAMCDRAVPRDIMDIVVGRRS